jgi:penicillin-binding protein 2
MAMAALNSGKRSATQIIHDGGSFVFGNHTFRSHGDHGLGPVDMVRAIALSSNVYFYSLANEMGVDLMHDELEPFGFGRKTGIDIEGEVTGLLPSTEWKRRAYKKPEQQKWYAGETISLGIGQGYNNFTMLQLASAVSTLVSKGERYKPRLVREVEDVVTRERRQVAHAALDSLPLRPEQVAVVVQGMQQVVTAGTGARVFAGAGYPSGGKTGTAQAVGVRANEKYNASKLEEHKRDHALYIAFAPLENPTIALAVIVENAGFGAASAAPIARRVMDYVLLGQYPSEEDIALTREGKTAAPVGTPRAASTVPLPGAAGFASATVGSAGVAGAGVVTVAATAASAPEKARP